MWWYQTTEGSSSRTNSGNSRNHGASLNIPYIPTNPCIFFPREWDGRASCADGEKIARPRHAEIRLLNYHSSPHSAIGVSPAVVLMGRQLATRLSVVREQLSPRQHRDGDIRNSDQHAKTTYKRCYDRRHCVCKLPKWRTSVAEIGWGEAVVDTKHCVQKWPPEQVRCCENRCRYLLSQKWKAPIQGVPNVLPSMSNDEPDDTNFQTEYSGEVLPPDDLGDEVVLPDDPGDEVLPPDVPGDEVLPPDDPGDEVVPPDDPGDEVVPPDDPGDEVVPPDDPGDEVVPPDDPGDEVVPPDDPGDEVVPPDDPGDEVLPPDDPGDEIVPLDDPRDEVLPPDDPGDEVVPPDDPGDAVVLPVDVPAGLNKSAMYTRCGRAVHRPVKFE